MINRARQVPINRFLATVALGFCMLVALTAQAQFNQTINYQGKLNDSVGVPVADGTYNIAFHLYTSPVGGAPVWSSTTTVPLNNGLFSYMLGSDDTLTGVDFDQTLYLGVNIGGTSTPAWDGEMTPRKIFGAVPAAFEAQNAQTLDNIATTSFLRSDVADTATALLTFSNGLISSASSTITELNTSTTTVTTFIIDGQTYTNIDGTGLQNDAGSLAVDFTALDSRYASTTDFDTEAELETLLTDVSDIYTNVDFAGNGSGLLFFDDGSDTLLASSTISANLLDSSVLLAGDIGSAVQAFDINTTLLGQSINLATEVDGTLGIASTSLGVTAAGIELSGDNIVLSSGYVIPLSASTTNWNTFYDTPSNRITGGTGISWSGNTLNLDNDFGASIDESELNIAGAPTNGYVLQASSTAAGGFVWQATSSLGISGQTLSLGTDNQIPFMNGAGDDLEYSSDFLFNGTDLDLAGVNTGLAFQGVRMFYASTTNDSIAIGEGAGATFNSNTTLTVALGFQAGQNASTTAIANTFIGTKAGQNSSGGINNLIGSSAGLNNNGASNNIVGNQAGRSNNGSDNVLIGSSAGRDNNGSYVTAIGDFAGLFNSGSENLILGRSAGSRNAGSFNNLLGSSAGRNNTGSYSEFIGFETGTRMSASNTVAIGQSALRGGSGSAASGNAATTTNNLALGAFAGYNVATGGDNNILMGYRAADSLTTGANNIIIGYDVEAPSNTGSNQLNIGNLIFGTGIDGTGTTLSSGNIGIGTTSPYAKLSIAGDLALTGGLFDSTNSTGTAGYVLQTTNVGTQWVATSSLGLGSPFGSSINASELANEDFGDFTVSGGTVTLDADVVGASELASSIPVSTFVNDAGYLDSVDLSGSSFLDLADTPGGWTTNAIPYESSSQLAFSSNFTFNGSQLTVGGTGIALSGTTANLGLGSNWLSGDGDDEGVFVDSSGNVGVGTSTPNARLTVIGDINIYDPASNLGGVTLNGVSLATGSSTANNYFFAGATSTSFASNSNYNFAFGEGALGSLSSFADNNIAIGLNSLTNNTSGFNNTALGVSALANNIDGYGNAAIGAGALLANTSGLYNIAIAQDSLSANTSGSNNIGIGLGVLNANTTGVDNIALGQYALSGNNGTGTIALGFQAGGNATAANRGIIIGYDIDFVSATADNQLNIGNLIFSEGIDGTGTTISSGNIGIGTTTPSSKLTVAGNGFFGGNLTATGTLDLQGAGTSTLAGNLDMAGDFALTGAFFDTTDSAGSNGFVLQSTGTSTQWVATSSLGLGSPFGSSINASELANEDFGDFTVSGGVASLDADVVGASELASSIPVSTFVNDAGYLDSVDLSGSSFLDLADTPGGWTTNAIPYESSSQLAFSGNFTFDGTDLNLGTSNGIIFGSDTRLSRGAANRLDLASGDSLNLVEGGVMFGGTRMFYASTTLDNIAIGQLAGENMVDNGNSGDNYNIFLGFGAGQNASSTASFGNQYNNLFGYGVGEKNTGSYNNLFGYLAGQNNTGIANNLFGFSAGQDNTGSYNNLFGYGAGQNNTGNFTNFLGLFAGINNTGSYSEFVGYETGARMSASNTVAIGQQSLRGGTGAASSGNAATTTNNLALGAFAGYNVQTGGDNNILMGYRAADSLTTGANNIIIGYDVEAPSNTGSNQLNIGNLIFATGIDGTGTTTSTGNLGIGTSSPSSKLTVAGNGFFGGNLTATGTLDLQGAGTSTLAGNLDIAGDLALTGALFDTTDSAGSNGFVLQSTGTSTRWVATSSLGIVGQTLSLGTDNQIPFMNAAGDDLEYSSNFTFDGTNLNLGGTNTGLAFQGTRFFYASTTNDSIAIGEGAGETFSNLTTNNIAIGFNAGRFSSTSDAVRSNYIGLEAGINSAGRNNNIIGYWAGRNNTGGDNNLFGVLTGENNSGFDNNIMGEYAGYNNTGDDNNIFGDDAGLSNTGNNNNIFGQNAGTSNQGSSNNLLGTSAGQFNVGSFNNNLGVGAGYRNSGSYNNFLGFYTGLNNTGSYSEFIGFETAARMSASNTVAIGQSALRGGTGAASSGNAATTTNNLALGAFAGYNVQTGGDNNILMGYRAADSLTTGANNIIIGYDVEAPSNTGSNQLNIGNLIFATGIDGTGTTTSTGNLGIGTTTPSSKLTVAGNGFFGGNLTATGTIDLQGTGTSTLAGNLDIAGNLALTGALFDTTDSAGSNGFVLQSTGTSTQWVATSSLGISGGVTTFTGLTDTQSSLNANRLIFTNSGGSALTDSADLVFDGSNLGVGTSTPESRLSLGVDAFTGAGTAALRQDIVTTNSTDGAVQYGNRLFLTASNTATTTIVGGFVGLSDTTTFGNTVRGFEVQADRGGNTQGENTALSGFARTFGVRAFTSADAGSSFEPAAGFFELGGSGTQGNAIRAYSEAITTSELLSLFQASSTFSGTGLLMNFGNSGGDFSSTSSKFVDFQNAGTSKFTVEAHGTTTIGDGTTNFQAGLQIGYGGLCVDNDGSCVASTTGQIASVSTYTGNSDLAEMYFSSQDLEPGELVVSDSFISVERARQGEAGRILGVVSTKPGVLMGSDDTSLIAGQQGYPLALTGRVPVLLSDENGPIAVGDPLTLSSVPGVAMKATGAAEVVGYALEAFTGTRAYTDGYINQFGDDIAPPATKALNVNDDARINDGCTFGGGGRIGGGAEECEPDTVSVAPAASETDTSAYDATQVALDALRTEPAAFRTTATGETVRVGRVTMFVERGFSFSAEQLAIFDELTSTSSDIVLGAEAGSGETLWDRLKVLAQGFVDGVLTITGLKTDRVETSELCVEDVCVTADDLRALLQAGSTNTEAAGTGDGADTSATDDAAVVHDTDSETSTVADGGATSDTTTSNSDSSTDTGADAAEMSATTEPAATTTQATNSTVATSTSDTSQPANPATSTTETTTATTSIAVPDSGATSSESDVSTETLSEEVLEELNDSTPTEEINATATVDDGAIDDGATVSNETAATETEVVDALETEPAPSASDELELVTDVPAPTPAD